MTSVNFVTGLGFFPYEPALKITRCAKCGFALPGGFSGIIFHVFYKQ